MKKLVCPACGTENSLRSVYSATSSSGLDALAMKCRDCGAKSPLLKTTVDHLVLFAVFGLLALVFYSGILELFPGGHFALVGVEFVIRFIPAMLLAMACMPIAWAVLGPAASADQAGAGLKIVRMTLGVCTALAVILMGLVGQFMTGVLDQPPSDPTSAGCRRHRWERESPGRCLGAEPGPGSGAERASCRGCGRDFRFGASPTGRSETRAAPGTKRNVPESILVPARAVAGSLPQHAIETPSRPFPPRFGPPSPRFAVGVIRSRP